MLAPDLVALPAAQYSTPAVSQTKVVTVSPDGKTAWIAVLVQDAVGLADGLFFVGLDDELLLADGLPVALGEPELDDDDDELGVELLDEQPAIPTAAMMATGTRTTALTFNSNLLHLSIGDQAWTGSPMNGAGASRRVAIACSQRAHCDLWHRTIRAAT